MASRASVKDSVAIDLEGICKHFTLHHNRPQSIGARFQSLIYSHLRQRREHFVALENIDLQVRFGEAVALVGHNGCGKTTLLQIIAGILQPNRGQISVNGKVIPLIQLGVGFQEELTGLENLYLNASFFGFSNAAITKKVDSIVSFAELERFIDTPLKHYSTGMQMRLGFAIAVHLEPVILLADEVLAVGDQRFSNKCYERIMELRRNGTTLILVSHSTAQVDKFCDRFVRLDHGHIIEQGHTKAS